MIEKPNSPYEQSLSQTTEGALSGLESERTMLVTMPLEVEEED